MTTSISTPMAQAGVVAAARRRRRLAWGRQALLQALCLLITLTVLFPILWILSIALDPRNIARPDSLNLIPPGANLDAFVRAIERPTENPVTFWELAFNSFKLATSTAAVSVAFGVGAAYAFSRLHFRFRQVLMIAVLGVLMLPSVATITPLFVLLNSIRIGGFSLRDSIPGVAMALISGALPFAIWNLKGYLDTIPKDLEEAAAVDGASRTQSFIRVVLPLAMPAIAVTAFLGFVAGWTDFYFSWMFLTKPQDFTLTMALYGMVGGYAATTPWNVLSAFSILVALPVSLVYLVFQRYIVGGLAIGGVKG